MMKIAGKKTGTCPKILTTERKTKKKEKIRKTKNNKEKNYF
jgi:hypothetical protein